MLLRVSGDDINTLKKGPQFKLTGEDSAPCGGAAAGPHITKLLMFLRAWLNRSWCWREIKELCCRGKSRVHPSRLTASSHGSSALPFGYRDQLIAADSRGERFLQVPETFAKVVQTTAAVRSIGLDDAQGGWGCVPAAARGGNDIIRHFLNV